jgi:tRNA(Ile)-lysidine synthase TilS/MesJ
MLVGHHLNDQAETLLLRLSRSTGLRGLSAMRAVVPLVDYGAQPHVSLWRPSLDIRKRELIAYCQAHSLEWIHDPSNDNFHFRRVYARRLVDTLETEFDCPPEDFAATSRLADTLDQVLEHAATEFLDSLRLPTATRSSASRRRRQSHDSTQHRRFHQVAGRQANAGANHASTGDMFSVDCRLKSRFRVLNRFDVRSSPPAARSPSCAQRTTRRKKFRERDSARAPLCRSTAMIVPFAFSMPRRYSQAPIHQAAKGTSVTSA